VAHPPNKDWACCPDYEKKELDMKKLALTALATTAMIAIATPASAQSVTGTINLTGSVAAKCLVLPGSGDTFGTAIGSPISLGELADASGKLRSGIATDINGAAGTTARVVCTSAAPTISVDATELKTLAAADTGYDNSIDFEASVAVVTTGTNNGPFINDSGSAPLAATAIGSRVANNGGTNITITTGNFRTNNLTDLLVASPTYTGSIVVVIAPGA
jgi:hypothetical protein